MVADCSVHAVGVGPFSEANMLYVYVVKFASSKFRQRGCGGGAARAWFDHAESRGSQQGLSKQVEGGRAGPRLLRSNAA